jgi:hypothetical protein
MRLLSLGRLRTIVPPEPVARVRGDVLLSDRVVEDPAQRHQVGVDGRRREYLPLKVADQKPDVPDRQSTDLHVAEARDEDPVERAAVGLPRSWPEPELRLDVLVRDRPKGGLARSNGLLAARRLLAKLALLDERVVGRRPDEGSDLRGRGTRPHAEGPL